MKYVKVTNGEANQYPYTIGKLRRDNPNVSFPKVISEELLASFGVYTVEEGVKPDCGVHQLIQRDSLPTLDNSSWVIGYTVRDMFSDATIEGVLKSKADQEAEHQVQLDEIAARENRTQRDKLISETDWWAVADRTMTSAQTSYRQAVRDITAHSNWPYLQEADWPTKP